MNFWIVLLLLFVSAIGSIPVEKVLFAVNPDDDEKVVHIIELEDEVQVRSYELKRNDSVYKIVKPLCRKVMNTSCDQLMATFHSYIYDNSYVPSAPNATLFDFSEGNRLHVVKYFAERFHYQKYLEIGTWHDILFNVSKTLFPYAVGVDPEQGGTHRMTSDAFFASNTEMFDIIFIDGLHDADQVFRDIQNSLLVLNEGGTIIMHDCNPLSEVMQNPLSAHTVWTGDTWKAAVAVRLKTDVEIIITDIDFGVGVIRRRENKHPLPPNIVKHLDVSPISMLDYEMLDNNRFTYLRLMSFEDMKNWVEEEFTVSY